MLYYLLIYCVIFCYVVLCSRLRCNVLLSMLWYVTSCYLTVCIVLFKSAKLERPQVEAILQLPQDPNEADEWGNTPLMAAS